MMVRLELGVKLVICLLAVALLRASDVIADDTEPKQYGFEIVNTYPHDTNAYTQGLLYLDGYLYESTGLNGQSNVRKVDLATGDVLKRQPLPRRYFGEGLVNWGDQLIYLTWRSQTAFVLDRETFRIKRRFNYRGEGWGITQNGEQLIMSNGSDTIRFYDPETFDEIKSIKVTDQSQSIRNINELEWVKGEIFANVWQSNTILRIDPDTGKVIGKVDMTAILPPEAHASPRDNVLNGIAYDAGGDRLFVTGKRWSKLFEIKLSELSSE